LSNFDYDLMLERLNPNAISVADINNAFGYSYDSQGQKIHDRNVVHLKNKQGEIVPLTESNKGDFLKFLRTLLTIYNNANLN